MQKFNRRIMYLTGIIIIFLLVFFKFRVPSNRDRVVARVGDQEITYIDFLAYAGRSDEDDFPLDEKIPLLDDMVVQRAVEVYAKKTGIFEDEIREQVQKEKDSAFRAILDRAFTRYAADTGSGVTGAEEKAFFSRHPYIALYHIAVPRINEDSRQRIGMAKELLEAGKPFFEVLKEFGDPSTQADSGFYGYYPQNLYSFGYPGFIEEAEKLSCTGQFSDVVASGYFYEILYRGKDPDFEKVWPMIFEWVRQEKYRDMLLELEEDLASRIVIDKPLLDQLHSMDDAAFYDSETRSRTVISYREEENTIRLEELLLILKDRFNILDARDAAPGWLIETATTIAREDLQVQYARDIHIDNTLRFNLQWQKKQAELEQARGAKLVTFIEDREMRISDSEILARFEKNPDRYRRSDIFKLQKIILADHETAKTAFKSVQAGVDFTDAVMEFSIDESKARTKGISAPMNREFLKDTYDVLEPFDTGDIVPPVPEDDHYVIYKILDRIDGAKLTFTQVKEPIRRKLLDEKWDQWFEQLQTEHGVKVEKYYEKLGEG